MIFSPNTLPSPNPTSYLDPNSQPRIKHQHYNLMQVPCKHLGDLSPFPFHLPNGPLNPKPHPSSASPLPSRCQTPSPPALSNKPQPHTEPPSLHPAFPSNTPTHTRRFNPLLTANEATRQTGENDMHITCIIPLHLEQTGMEVSYRQGVKTPRFVAILTKAG